MALFVRRFNFRDLEWSFFIIGTKIDMLNYPLRLDVLDTLRRQPVFGVGFINACLCLCRDTLLG
jgi:hypothetical protein